LNVRLYQLVLHSFPTRRSSDLRSKSLAICRLSASAPGGNRACGGAGSHLRSKGDELAAFAGTGRRRWGFRLVLLRFLPPFSQLAGRKRRSRRSLRENPPPGSVGTDGRDPGVFACFGLEGGL